MNKFLGILIFLIALALGGYIGLWLMFINPIISACSAFDAGTLTASIVGWTVVKCLCATAVGSVIVYIGGVIGIFVYHKN